MKISLSLTSLIFEKRSDILTKKHPNISENSLFKQLQTARESHVFLTKITLVDKNYFT